MMRLPVDHTTCTVLGSRAKSADDPLWAGLDLSRAELREWTDDHHLGVPWLHPEDQLRWKDDPDYWAIYRVRPKMEPGKKWKGKRVENVAFERWSGKWWLAISFATPAVQAFRP